MYKFIETGKAVANQGGAMEAETITKNGRKSKSQISGITSILKKVAIVAIALHINSVANSQQLNDKVEPTRSELHHSFFVGIRQDGILQSPKEVKSIMSDYPRSLRAYKTGRTFEWIGAGFLVVGFFPLVVTHGGDPGTMIMGAGLYGVGVLTSVSGTLIQKRSVSLYNSKIINNSVSYQVNLGLSTTGIGLTVRF